MTHLYLTEPGARLNMDQHRLCITSRDGTEHAYPIDTVESISLFGRFTLTSAVIAACLRSSIDVYFYSGNGSYFGHLSNEESVSISRLRRQVELTNGSEFQLSIARSIVRAKIVNQMALLEAYDTDDRVTAELTAPMMHSLKSLNSAPSLNAIIGFEGNAAKAYFRCLGLLVPPEFAFSGRSRRPPRDRFNSMLSLGYTILHRNVLGAIERHGLNPYLGFLHVDRQNHPALVSDLMEEWRPFIVDDTALSLANGGDITPSMFDVNEETGVTLHREALRTFLGTLREKMLTEEAYLPGDDRSYTFQTALDAQLDQLGRALDEGVAYLYHPVSVEEP